VTLINFCASRSFFRLDDNRKGAKMPDLLTSAQMRAIEQAAIASGEVTGLDLMERAASGAVGAVLEEWPALAKVPNAGATPASPRPFGRDQGNRPQGVVLCGPGNNGGDGFAMARLLFRKGWQVHVLFFGDASSRLPPDAEEMRRQWEALGRTEGWNREAMISVASRLDPGQPLLVIDALFGIGLSRPLGPAATAPWDAFCSHASSLPKMGALFLCAVDVPSGVSDSSPAGARLTWFDSPDIPCLTVTFHAPKAAHHAMLAAGERLRIVDIGLSAPKEDPK